MTAQEEEEEEEEEEYDDDRRVMDALSGATACVGCRCLVPVRGHEAAWCGDSAATRRLCEPEAVLLPLLLLYRATLALERGRACERASEGFVR